MPLAAEHTVALAHAPGPIRSYAGWAAWQDTTADGRRYVIRVRAPDGAESTRPERADVDDPDDPRPDGLPFDLGPDARGRPSIVVSTCDRVGEACRIRIGRLPDAPARPVGETAQDGVAPGSPTLWRGRLAWAHGDVQVRYGPGLRPRRLPVRGDVGDLELRGGRLAMVVHYVPPQGNFADRLELRPLGAARGRTLARVYAGEGGQSILGPQFYDGRTLGWLTTCLGDPGGCVSRAWGFVRRDLRTGATRTTPDHHQHEGWAPIGRDAVVAGPADCAGDATAPWECVIRRRALGG